MPNHMAQLHKPRQGDRFEHVFVDLHPHTRGQCTGSCAAAQNSANASASLWILTIRDMEPSSRRVFSTSIWETCSGVASTSKTFLSGVIRWFVKRLSNIHAV